MSKIEVNEIVNQSGDNDSGIDLTTNDQIGFKIANASKWTLNSSGNLFPASTSQGIVLGSTSDTSANRLDDYEEGTWTPTLPNGGTVNSITDAHYIKIGNAVIWYCYVGLTPTNNSSYFRIGGLPHTPIIYNHGGGSIQYSQTLNVQHWSGPLTSHDGFIYFHRSDGNTAQILNSAFGGSQYNLILHGVYTIL
tara:strand:- start:311 stop:889 length:579 start_codon:yes stop_codon:yes gene_type:complete